MGLFLVCVGMIAVFSVYLSLLWFASVSSTSPAGEAARPKEKGLTAAELSRIGGAGDGGEVAGAECAVCLDDIEAGQAARVIPGCRHAFHRRCADQWLAAHPQCPLCRALLLPPPAE
ncbi:E3 ubiquitin-protein ligase ATL23-like [Typha angustifolia]|uniref:E3 ubiquitin-protein ligase ATL23-like n=1 Tax=Typha angustifolia TaxID=59011 RepID=UPI003C2F2DE5